MYPFMPPHWIQQGSAPLGQAGGWLRGRFGPLQVPGLKMRVLKIPWHFRGGRFFMGRFHLSFS